MQTMRLRHIALAEDFRASELTIYKEIIKKRPNLKLNVVGANDVILVRNKNGDILMFLHGWVPVDGPKGEHLNALRSEKLRLDKRRPWNPLMLQNYAAQVGIKLEGIKSFEEQMTELTKSLAKAFAEAKKNASFMPKRRRK